MPTDSAISELSESAIVALVASELERRRSTGDIVDTLVLKGLSRKEARHAVSMIRHGFDAAMSTSLGIQAKPIWSNDPYFSAARQYAQIQIGSPNAPRIFQRKWAVLGLAMFSLLCLAAVIGSFLIGNYMSDRAIHAIGMIAAIISLVLMPLMFYYIWALGLDGWNLSFLPFSTELQRVQSRTSPRPRVLADDRSDSPEIARPS